MREFGLIKGESRFLNICLIILLVFLTYYNSIWNGFVYDDWDFVIGGTGYEEAKPLLYPFIHDLRKGESFRPLRDVSHAIDRMLWKGDPMGHHIMSIIFHALTAVVVFLIGLRIFGAGLPAFLMGIFWGIHPIQTESVSWISGRRDILCGLFYLLGLLMFVEYVRSRKRHYIIWVILCYMLTLSSKEMGVSLPLALALYDYVFMGHGREAGTQPLAGCKERVRYIYIPLLILALVFSLLTVEVTTSQRRGEFYGGGRYLTLLGMFKVFAGYIRLLLYPVGLCAEHDVRIPETLVEPMTLISVVIVISILWMGFEKLRKDRLVGFSILWFFITLIPVSNVIVPIGNIMAERYLYIPSLGFCILVSALVYRIRSNWLKVLTGFVLISVYMFLTINRNRDWKDDFTLWSKTSKQSPFSTRPLYNLANACARKDMFYEAILFYRRAISIDPYSAKYYNNLGHVYTKMGQYETAKNLLRIAIKLEPNLALAHHNLGVLYEKEGNYKEAMNELEQAMRLAPDSAMVHYNLGCVYEHEGELRKSLYHYGQAVIIEPSNVRAINNLGCIYLKLGMFDEAKLTWQKALEVDPDFKTARDNLKIVSEPLNKK